MALTLAAVSIALIVFAFDTFSGYESAIAVLYAVVLVLVAPGRDQRVLVAAALVCGALTVMSFVATHWGAMDASNIGRVLVALVAIALTAALLFSRLSLHQARTALGESEANLRIMADTVPQILWQALPDGRIVYLSRRWTEMTGATIADGLAGDGLAFLGWFHPDEQPTALEEWTEFIRDGVPFEFYRRLRMADGSHRWLQISASPVRAAGSGEIEKWAGVATDIDDEMRAQLTVRATNQTLEARVAERTAELARSERRYRSAFEQTHVAMLELDLTAVAQELDAARLRGNGDGAADLAAHPEAFERCLNALRVLDANRAAVDLFGATDRETLLARRGPLIRSRTAEDIDRYYALVERRETIEAEAEIVVLDGRVVKVLFGVSPIEAPDGRCHVLVGMIDVTERDRAQELLLAAQEELGRANRAATLGALSASIAHELNQPIGAVMMDAQTAARWLERDPPDLASAKRALARVAGNAERASGILRRTREQLVKGRRSVEPLDAGEVAASAIALIERELRLNRTRAELRVADDLAPVEADRIELQQVIINLVMNAVQAMRDTPPAEREVIVDVSRVETEVAVAITDRGSGIDPAHIDRLFEAFYTTKPGGMGMGLQICRATIESFGGTLDVRNNEAKGATFAFTLPLLNGDER
ncbi:Nodulation protein V [Stappia sp. 22II-S9-Z10]|nr:Nodulation protein V [Stappia sp. 22II-S9-Z10]